MDDAKARRFEQLLLDHPDLWRMFEAFTTELIERGVPHYSADAILHRVRFETAGRTPDDQEWRCNNDFTALLARRWAELHPHHAHFFRRRRSVFDQRRAA